MPTPLLTRDIGDDPRTQADGSTLRKEGVIVGLHCCSNTDWKSVLAMDLSYLSIDTNLSLENLLGSRATTDRIHQARWKAVFRRDSYGRSSALHSLDAKELFDGRNSKLASATREGQANRAGSEKRLSAGLWPGLHRSLMPSSLSSEIR